MELEECKERFEDAIMTGEHYFNLSPTEFILVDVELDFIKVKAKDRGEIDIETGKYTYLKLTEQTILNLQGIIAQTYSITDKEFEEAEGIE